MSGSKDKWDNSEDIATIRYYSFEFLDKAAAADIC